MLQSLVHVLLVVRVGYGDMYMQHMISATCSTILDTVETCTCKHMISDTGSLTTSKIYKYIIFGHFCVFHDLTHKLKRRFSIHLGKKLQILVIVSHNNACFTSGEKGS